MCAYFQKVQDHADSLVGHHQFAVKIAQDGF